VSRQRRSFRSSCSVGRSSCEPRCAAFCCSSLAALEILLLIFIFALPQEKFIPTLRNVKMALLYPSELVGSVSSEPAGVVDASKHLVEWSLGELKGGSKNAYNLKFELDPSLHKPLVFTLKARFDPSVLTSVPDNSGPTWSIPGMHTVCSLLCLLFGLTRKANAGGSDVVVFIKSGDISCVNTLAV
jgi:hypothetical protein